MFFGDERLPIMRQMILASSDEAAAAALEELREAQKADFVAILEAMDGLPVIVRGLDPPLHEFLPDIESLVIKQATEGLNEDEQQLFDAAKSWHEANPMIGVRGVRLGVLKPGLYGMQVRALMEAAYERAAAGGHPVVEIMIPLTVSREEMALARSWVVKALEEAAAAEGGTAGEGVEIAIGTMIETPRAALLADQIAEEADFFSFGTNDLTQMTFGFSRDDVEGRMMDAYSTQGLLKSNPFENVDTKAWASSSASPSSGAGRHARDEDRRLRGARRRPRLDRLLRPAPVSTTSAARPSGCPSPGSPRPRPCSRSTPRRQRRPRRPRRRARSLSRLSASSRPTGRACHRPAVPSRRWRSQTRTWRRSAPAPTSSRSSVSTRR